ncbi:hypothetical protein U9M48_012372 [Paspalum notatum var. saurae]|uniref:N-acetyltransferase domain-containing protein n=1 Tax=Paspalum notatum var. saurae TaxID=547442 RepID=A0AAQ3WIB4_PASNO
MAVLRASALFPPQPLPPSSRSRRRPTCRGVVAAVRPGRAPSRSSVHGGGAGAGAKKWLLATGRRPGGEVLPCLAATEEGVGAASVVEEEEEEYLAREAGWGVRRMARVGEEMRRVAQVQAEAFHVPVALFNDFFFDFFKAEVLSALIYKVRNSPPDRYACLVAEEAETAATQLSQAPYEKIIGVVDCTVQGEDDVVKHLQGADEYLYVSGIAVLPSFRRRKVGTALLKACEALGLQWRHKFMVLRAYEDDDGARGLYAKAGYVVVSRDPDWVTWVGRRRRVLMIKELPVHDTQIEHK